MAKISIHAEYLSYECHALDPDWAQTIASVGIAVDDLEALEFFDGGDMGVVKGQVAVDGQVIKDFDIQEMPAATNDKNKGWVLLQVESGTVSYELKVIDGQFNEDLLEFKKYNDAVNGHKMEYAYPMYAEEDFEEIARSNNYRNLLLINPDGKSIPFDIIEDED